MASTTLLLTSPRSRKRSFDDMEVPSNISQNDQVVHEMSAIRPVYLDALTACSGKDSNRQASPALSTISSLSSLSATTPVPSTPHGSSTYEGPKTKKRKPTFAEKQEEERQSILKRARREEERNVKNEERRVKNEAKEVKKREKDLEKQVKEDEKRRKEEEIEKKERVSLWI